MLFWEPYYLVSEREISAHRSYSVEMCKIQVSFKQCDSRGKTDVFNIVHNVWKRPIHGNWRASHIRGSSSGRILIYPSCFYSDHLYMHTYMYNQQREREYLCSYFFISWFIFGSVFFFFFAVWTISSLPPLLFTLRLTSSLSPLFEATISVLTPQESGFIEMQWKLHREGKVN